MVQELITFLKKGFLLAQCKYYGGLETIGTEGLIKLLRELFYVNREAIIYEKDFLNIEDSKHIFDRANVDFVELTSDNIQRFQYSPRSRYYRALLYRMNGYQGFALVRVGKVIGYIWYYSSRISDKPIDIELLGLKEWSIKDIYTFDIFLLPEERGKYLSSALQNMAIYALKTKGYTRAYTYIWNDNIPSIWMTRVTNKWKEIRRVHMSRFIFRIGAK